MTAHFATSHKTKVLVRLYSWLLIVASLAIAPLSSNAASPQPKYFGPSNYMPTVKNNYCSGQRSREVPIGTQVYGSTGYNTAHFHLLQDSQSAWLRNSVNWSTIEPINVTPEQYKWGSVDQMLNAAIDNCVNMIVTIDGTPKWARIEGSVDARSPFKAENLPDFVEFVTTLVERYNGDGIHDAPSGIVIDYWEFYNEPDFGSEVAEHEGWGEYAQRYAQMLEAVYQPIHDINPDAKVVFGGLAYSLFVGDPNGGLHVRDFLRNVLEAGGAEHFDIMNFHYYPFQYNRLVWTDTNSSGLVEKYASLQSIMAAYNVEKPFMITELASHSETRLQQHPSTPEYQARRVLELLTQAISLGSEVTIWWSFADQGQTFPYKTGLTTPGEAPTHKPSYTVYQEVIRRLGNSEFVETTVKPTQQNDLEVYRFLDKYINKTFYVAWLNSVMPVNDAALSSFNDGDTVPFQVDGSTATIISKEGVQVEVINDDADGNTDAKVTVLVGRNPIYIVID